jgi:hypothetical protein
MQDRAVWFGVQSTFQALTWRLRSLGLIRSVFQGVTGMWWIYPDDTSRRAAGITSYIAQGVLDTRFVHAPSHSDSLGRSEERDCSMHRRVREREYMD